MSETVDRLTRVANLPPDCADVGGELRAALGDDLALLALFVSPAADFAAVCAATSEALPDVSVIACTTAGEIDRGYVEGRIVAVGLPKAHFRAATVVFPDLGALDAARQVRELILARKATMRAGPDFHHEFAFLMVDGITMREDALMRMVAQGLGPVPLFGGSAGDGQQFDRCLVAHNGRVMTNAAVLAFLRTDCPIKVFSFDHLEPGDKRMVVTKADRDGRIVRRINDEPAAREYARILGKDPDQLSTFTFAAHPLVVRVGGQYYVRSIQRVTEDGDLVFYSAIDEGVVLTLAQTRDIAETLEQDLQAIAKMGDLDRVLICDCVLRRQEAEQTQASRTMSDSFRRHDVVGFSTYGEQYGATHVNMTMTGVAFFHPQQAPRR
ncbi:FIST N-terminal domain-containing protein [uncultured Paracoccus sp.]|uniref:FIST N-terminal domain-containing protein n=1 Tax=uncultured Paracoccus sp. TaxID=189685 RepID=UPI0026337D40|nr:FIST N-terminal domain-containing protein [uncultured Paracoccus sp.]